MSDLMSGLMSDLMSDLMSGKGYNRVTKDFKVSKGFNLGLHLGLLS